MQIQYDTYIPTWYVLNCFCPFGYLLDIFSAVGEPTLYIIMEVSLLEAKAHWEPPA